mgnify:CR=1 FL=1
MTYPPNTLSLVADIGGTNTRCALANGPEVLQDTVRRYSNSEFSGLEAVLRQYLSDEGDVDPAAACVAVAGPVHDGVAGEGTIREVNVSAARRLGSVLAAMERERWFGQDKGDRHVWVNLTDFSAKIIDHGQVTFSTRSVIGAVDPDRETPEFSDIMEYMVINPSWYVPRSIVTKEYLPQMQRNRGAASHLLITDRNGRTVNRANIDFNRYNARNFPFSMRQPPSNRNALGLVKFMFPNQYNIYLHDTPAKNLFARKRLTIECSSMKIERSDSEWSHRLDQFQVDHGPTVELLRTLPDFSLFKLTPISATFIKGFGQAFKLESDNLEAVSQVTGQ